MDEHESFDPEQHELQMVNKIFDNRGSLFIDGSFYFAEEEQEEKTQTLMELLTKTRKLPEIVIFFMVSQSNMKKRLFDKGKIKE